MADVIKMHYPDMERMTSIFKQSAGQLEEMIREMHNCASMMQNGALQGQAGEAFVDALNKFGAAIERLRTKLVEEANDVDGAKIYMQYGDATAQSRFK